MSPSEASRIEHHDRLRAERAVLRAAEADDVDAGVGGEGAQRQVQRRGGVRQPRTVHEDTHPALVRVVGDRTHLVGRVDGAELARLGDVDDERLRPVLVAPPPGFLGDEVGRELAVGRRDREQLDAAGLLRCAALVGVDVRRLCADDRSPAGQHRQQSDDVGAGAVEHRDTSRPPRRSAVRTPLAGGPCTRPRRRRPGVRRWRRRSQRAPRGAHPSSCRRRSRGRWGHGVWPRFSNLVRPTGRFTWRQPLRLALSVQVYPSSRVSARWHAGGWIRSSIAGVTRTRTPTARVVEGRAARGRRSPRVLTEATVRRREQSHLAARSAKRRSRQGG